MKKLTIRRNNFCKEYVLNGGNATQAYKKAYNCDNMKEKTINNNAYQLLKKSDIIARLKEIQQPIIEKFNYEINDCFNELVELQELTKKKGDYKTYIKCIELKGKLCGLFKDNVKVEGEINTNVSINFLEKKQKNL